MAGTFISFEGIEGCGKTTQIRLLDEHLRKTGYKTLLTREPGGTCISEKIRDILLSPESCGMTPETELFLYAASRNQHIAEKIIPALSEGKIVLCDRYADATTAYQGAARRLHPDTICEVHKIATGGLWPKLTILMDLPAERGLERALARNAQQHANGVSDRFEREELSFHERVREGYLKIAREEPSRVMIVDATRTVEEISKVVINIVSEMLSKQLH